MTKPSKVLRDVGPQWTDAHMEQQLLSLKREKHHREKRRRSIRNASAGALSVAALIALAFVGLNAANTASPQESVAERDVEPAPEAPTFPVVEPPGRTISLADGSQLFLESAESAIFVERMESEEIVVRLDSGETTFDVTRNPRRSFEVRSGEVSVRVLGTRFSVHRLPDQSRVEVARGRVSVTWSGGEQVLGAGESGVFPPALLPEGGPEDGVEEDVEAEDVDAEQRPSMRAHQASVRQARPSWRSLAREGRHDEAFSLLSTEPEPVGVSDSMLAADAARFSGHPLAALPHLRRVHIDHSGDPRAALAVFTEGRVLLAARRATGAARAFRRAQELEPSGPLAEDALAREVEALALAGSPQAARRADIYRRRYPNGRRAQAVERALNGNE